MEISIRPFTVEEALLLSDDFLENGLYLEKCMIEDGEITQEDLEERDYTVLKIKFPQVSYIMYHGFPGDNAAGAIILSKVNVDKVYLREETLPEELKYIQIDGSIKEEDLEAHPDLREFYYKWYCDEDYGHLQLNVE